MSITQKKQAIGPNQEKWLSDLESGKRKQGMSLLVRDTDDRCCCLGVACLIFRVTQSQGYGRCVIGGVEQPSVKCRAFDNHTTTAPLSIVNTLALRDSRGGFAGTSLRGCSSLAAANDAGASFAEIAAFCREHPEAVFTEPR